MLKTLLYDNAKKTEKQKGFSKLTYYQTKGHVLLSLFIVNPEQFTLEKNVISRYSNIIVYFVLLIERHLLDMVVSADKV